MVRRCFRVVVPLALLVRSAGCDRLKSCSRTAGVVIKGLFSSNWTITCSATYADLNDTEFVVIDMDDLGPFVQMGLTVESGAAVRSFFDGTGFPVSITASIGVPAVYAGSVQMALGPDIILELSPIGDPASNMHYEVTFAG